MLKPVLTAAFVLASLVIASEAAHAQSPAATKPGFELILPSGRTAATGEKDDDATRANLTAVQLSYGLRPDVVFTSTFGWARTTPRNLGPDAKLDLFTSDAGLEFRQPRRSTDRRINFKPFTGAGVGVRTQNYRHVDLATTHRLATYASAGGELGLSHVRVRLEVRDYLTWATSTSTRRNDVAVLAGLRLSLR